MSPDTTGVDALHQPSVFIDEPSFPENVGGRIFQLKVKMTLTKTSFCYPEVVLSCVEEVFYIIRANDHVRCRLRSFSPFRLLFDKRLWALIIAYRRVQSSRR